ncbi:hypothetical protein NL676_034796 [Syzygium grande]|nr:hypothetical protein NL676_034796 [Syzygium grande]
MAKPSATKSRRRRRRRRRLQGTIQSKERHDETARSHDQRHHGARNDRTNERLDSHLIRQPDRKPRCSDASPPPPPPPPDHRPFAAAPAGLSSVAHGGTGSGDGGPRITFLYSPEPPAVGGWAVGWLAEGGSIRELECESASASERGKRQEGRRGGGGGVWLPV